MKPITGIAVCCARAARDHAAAELHQLVGRTLAGLQEQARTPAPAPAATKASE